MDRFSFVKGDEEWLSARSLTALTVGYMGAWWLICGAFQVHVVSTYLRTDIAATTIKQSINAKLERLRRIFSEAGQELLLIRQNVLILRSAYLGRSDRLLEMRPSCTVGL